MKVRDLTDIHIRLMKEYNGTKTIRELMNIFQIDCNKEYFRNYFLRNNNISYKKEPNKYIGQRLQVLQTKGMKLKVGKRYLLTKLTNKKEEPFYSRYKGKIIKEYKKYYLGIRDSGYVFTIMKYPLEWEIKEL